MSKVLWAQHMASSHRPAGEHSEEGPVCGSGLCGEMRAYGGAVPPIKTFCSDGLRRATRAQLREGGDLSAYHSPTCACSCHKELDHRQPCRNEGLSFLQLFSLPGEAACYRKGPGGCQAELTSLQPCPAQANHPAASHGDAWSRSIPAWLPLLGSSRDLLETELLL
ncbi:unnamed protein product [Caretta caretta]